MSCLHRESPFGMRLCSWPTVRTGRRNSPFPFRRSVCIPSCPGRPSIRSGIYCAITVYWSSMRPLDGGVPATESAVSRSMPHLRKCPRLCPPHGHKGKKRLERGLKCPPQRHNRGHKFPPRATSLRKCPHLCPPHGHKRGMDPQKQAKRPLHGHNRGHKMKIHIYLLIKI